MQKFYKYSAAGNDFILLESDKLVDQYSTEVYRQICHRRQGIGADGVLVVHSGPWKMEYFNSDGQRAEMCGNGVRSIGHFIFSQYPDYKTLELNTDIGPYQLKVEDGEVWVKMEHLKDQQKIEIQDLYPSALSSFYIDSGVPHTVYQVEDSVALEGLNLDQICPKIRYDKRFKNGTNVNFYREQEEGIIQLRVYERGVEGETFSSGTGATATALSYLSTKSLKSVLIKTKGGDLKLFLDEDGSAWLTGPVKLSFSGTFDSHQF